MTHPLFFQPRNPVPAPSVSIVRDPVRLLCSAIGGLLLSEAALAHPVSFNSTITYSSTQPSGASGSVAQWSGAAFDAANIGGSGVNADGGADNGTANDASTRVLGGGQPIQGQTFTTGSNANGYDVTGITARMAGYTSNTASGANMTSWNLAASNGPIHATVARINGTTHSPVSIQNFMAGGTGNPGSGTSVNGTGTYLTFNLPFPVHLEPNTTYGFDLIMGNGSGNHFEWLGTSSNPYADGTAYSRTWTGTITPLTGDRVFQVNMTASAAPHAPFVHPGALHTQADFDRMKAKIAAGAEPWKACYDQLAGTPHAQTNWNPYNTDYINRGGSDPNNYTRSQQDAQAIYHLSLRWKLTGDVAYANRAVQIANVWSDLTGISGDSNASLAAGICGYLFATGGEILSTYPGWPAAEKQAYKDMMMRVFYPGNADFLWRHHGTPNTTGGNTHYRLNWDTANMASMAAIGILCDNKAVYQQAVDYFKNGAGNSRAERAAWFIHPDGTSQTEESGRDQPHNKGGWYAMGLLCQMAWNQGEDLFGYDNNRVLRAYEYNAKYNNGTDVSWVYHRNSSLSYTEGLAESGRSPGGYPSYELIYNHYAGVKGIAAPWTKIGMNAIRPEGATGTGGHPSAQDHLGLGSLTYARDNANSAAPGGLLAQWGKNQVALNWWGSATATSYQIQRTASGASSSGPYTTLGTATEPNLNFTDTSVTNGGSYYYKVIAITPTGNLESAPLRVNQALVASYTFEGNTNDGTGTRHGTLKGTTLPGYAAGSGGGQAISLNGVDQYVQLPVHSGLSRDITLATWVYWNGGNAWQRVFDFGSEIEKFMMLTVKEGTGKIGFTMTTSRGADGTIALVGPVMPTATWTHLAVTFNSETATLYVNGLPVAAGSSPRLAPMFSQPFCYLGRSMWNGDPYFNGRIDNFGIYNYGMTGKEVYALWGQGGTNAAPVFTANPMTKPVATQGTAYTGQSIAATDANGGTLTYSKATGPAWLTVASNGALSGTPTNADVGKNLFVVRVTDASGATDDANLYITVNNVNDAPTWNTPSLSGVTVSEGQTYPTASLAGDASDVDSPYGDTFTYSKVGGPAWLVISSDGSLSGTPGAGDGGVNTFTVRVTDSSGAYSEVTLIITVLPASLRAHYDFESNADDDLGNFDGTVTGTATYAAGRYGNGLVFDGSSTHVTLPANAADYQDITVAAWVNWNGGGDYQRIFDFGNGTNHYLFLTPKGGGGFRFAIKNGGAEQSLTVSPALTVGQWTHVALTLKGDTATLYANGVPVGVNNAITINPYDIKPASNYIGKSQFGSDPLFNGMIDSFRVYNHALDAAVIQTIAADGITHLKFNESSGTSAADATGSGWDGTLATGSAWSGSGKLGGAVDLNGTGGHVSLPAGIVNGITTATIATWVNLDTIGNWQRIFDFGTGTTNYMFLTPKTGPYMRFAITTSGGGGEQRIDSPELTTGWHHVAVVLNGSSGTLYLDGVQVGQNTAMTLNPASLGNTTLNYLGKSQYNDPYLDGRLDDFRILERALTAAEISALAGSVPAPGSPAITAGNAQAGLTWTAVSGATRHVVKRGTTSGGPYTLVGSVTGTSFTDTGLTNGTPYYYVVAGVNSLGEGLPTAQLTATPLAAVAAAPGGVAANGWNGNVQVSWNASVGAVSYNVLRSTTSGSGYASIASGVTSTGYTDTSASDGVTYYYVVTATNSGGTSGNSAQASALVTKPRMSLSFNDGTGTTAADASGNSWNGTLVNGPLWAYGRAGGSLWFDGGNDHVTLPTGVVNGLTSTTIAFWADLDSVSTWSRLFDFGTGTTTNMFLTPKNGANGNIRFAITTGGGAGEQKIDGTAPFPVTGWHHVTVTLSGATGTLYVDGVQVGQNTAMTLTPSSLGATTLNRIGRSQYGDPYLAGRVDEFRVYPRALSAAEVASVMAGGPGGLATPTGVTASAAVGQITVNWTAVAGATGYEVLRSTTSGGPYVTVATNVSGTSNTNAALPAATTYHYVVVAHNATSDSMNSAEVSASTP